jgi:hypothetical protein
MNKYKTYPEGILRFSIKTSIPRFPLHLLRFIRKLFLKNARLPLKFELLLLPSHDEILPNIDVNPDFKFPTIDVLIPFHPKDIGLLPHCLLNVLRNSCNPIGTVRIVTTTKGVTLAQQELKTLQSEHALRNINIEVIDEKVFLPAEILNTCNSLGEGSGWLIQQSIKLWNAVVNQSVPTVVLDSDTIIVQRILWVDADEKSLVFANFHENHVSDFFAQMFPNIIRTEKDFGYVSHFVLMKPQIVLRLLLQVEESARYQLYTSQQKKAMDVFEVRLANVISMLLNECMFNFSEYDIYAKVALKLEPDKTLISKWSNLSLDVNEKIDNVSLQRLLAEIRRNYLSLSIHTFSLGFSGPARTHEILQGRISQKDPTE